MTEKLEHLLKMNSITRDQFDEVMYKQMLLIIFSQIVKVLQDDKVNQEILSKIRKTNNEKKVIQLFVSTHLDMCISEDDSQIILPWILAFFRKSSTRTAYPLAYKNKLLRLQNYKCKYCGVQISISTSELEHQVPWTYVGDILKDNLVMTCMECNREKGRNVNRGLKYLLLNKMI